MKYAIILLVALGLIAAAGVSSANAAIYMKYGNPIVIEGESTAKGFEKQIEVNSFQWGVGRAISSVTGGGTREASVPSISEITITKMMDKSSPGLLKESLVGKGEDVTFSLTRIGGSGTLETYAKYDLFNVLISGYSVSSGGDRPSESLSLNFQKIIFTLWVDDGTGKLVQQTPVCYDIALAKTC